MTKWLAVLVLVVGASACKDEKAREKVKELGDKAGSSAEAIADEAKARAKSLADQLGPLQQHLIDLDQRLSKAAEDLSNADSEDARVAAKAALDRLRRQKQDLEQKLAELRARLETP